ncbi:Endonuclease 2 [Morella rubra]|uniref:Aspergillus nuclease S1 n=1 Tax=Morella rubra TaxID=262757 RepID=A0A6A1W846_9ROSI|nr:Endonuclease 2 [Morella rubra]
MECCRVLMIAIVALMLLFPVTDAWGIDGHDIVCNIAQSRLNEAAADIVQELLPKSAENDLGSVCSWADQVKFRYHWSSPLHYVNTPDVCNYNFERDCKDDNGEQGRCVAGAVQNYTKQLLTIGSNEGSSYNLTEALLFYSHFMGDIHQPLHAGFASDKGGNTIEVHWYTRKQNLHHIWDDNIIETAEERYYNSNVAGMIDAIQKNITTEWADQVKDWESCSYTDTTCADVIPRLLQIQIKRLVLCRYASEGIQAACDWAYKGAAEGSVLKDEYFLSRLPIVNTRLAQAGVRLAAILNHYFK